MPKSLKRRLAQELKTFQKTFLQTPHLPFQTDFSTKAIAEIIKNTPQKLTSVFTPLITLKAFICQVLSDDGSCKSAVIRVLTDRLSKGLPPNSVNTGPYCKARMRLPLDSLEKAVKSVGSLLHREFRKWGWRGHHVVLLDGTTVLMPDTPENQEVFPQQTNQKPGLGFPIARMIALISLATGAVINYRVGAYQGKNSGETSLFSAIMSSLSPGDILVADRYYCTFAIIALLQKMGVDALFKQHAKKKTDFRKGKKIGKKDSLVEWEKPLRKPVWMTDEEYEELPETITVRVFSAKGTVYVTTLQNSCEFTKKDLADLYKERWKIELDLRSIKTNMGMEMVRCKTPEMVKKEIAAHLLAYNIVRGTMAQAAVIYHKNPRSLSFRATVQIITAARCPRMTGKSLGLAVIAMLKAIASNSIGNQTRKSQPRAVKRRPKPYPLLTTPRIKYGVSKCF